MRGAQVERALRNLFRLRIRLGMLDPPTEVPYYSLHYNTTELQLTLLPPLDEAASWSHFPFRGAGSRPATGAGPVLELRVPQAAHARVLEVTLA